MKNIIKLIKSSLELCHCILPGLDTKFYHVFDQYRINCFFDFVDQKYFVDQNIVIIYMKNYPVDLERNFFKDIHYSFIYRQQKCLPLPSLESDIHNQLNLIVYIDFLLREYINNIKLHDWIISNPIYNYEHMVWCSKIVSKKVFRKVILLPYIS